MEQEKSHSLREHNALLLNKETQDLLTILQLKHWSKLHTVKKVFLKFMAYPKHVLLFVWVQSTKRGS